MSVKALYNMFTKNLTILGFIKVITCDFKHNVIGKGCNFKFNNLFFNVWCVMKWKCHSTRLHPIYNHCPLWSLVISGNWILLAHWIWYCNIIDQVWLWSNIFWNEYSWCHCKIITMKKLSKHFWTWCLVGLAFKPNYSLTKVWNFVGSFKNCVKKHWLINVQFHKIILS